MSEIQNIGVTRIRPKVILGKIESDPTYSRGLWMNILMPPTLIGSATLLETAILIALCKLSCATQVFEFGTYLGGTTAVLAANLEGGRVTSIDLDTADIHVLGSGSQNHNESAENDDFLRRVSMGQLPQYVEHSPESVRKRIQLLKGDSRDLDIVSLNFQNKFDLVFIDGGHDSVTVASDSANAFQMIKENGVVVWHDYGSNVHSEVTDYVNSLADQKRIYTVEATSLAFFWKSFVSR